ncbi:hypothetical protein C8J57DRAFT_1394557, partial [Mycena rebaudengoi]
MFSTYVARHGTAGKSARMPRQNPVTEPVRTHSPLFLNHDGGGEPRAIEFRASSYMESVSSGSEPFHHALLRLPSRSGVHLGFICRQGSALSPSRASWTSSPWRRVLTSARISGCASATARASNAARDALLVAAWRPSSASGTYTTRSLPIRLIRPR